MNCGIKKENYEDLLRRTRDRKYLELEIEATKQRINSEVDKLAMLLYERQKMK